MLAIGVTILTSVQLNFIPVWNTQEELDHLQKMFDDFKELKSGIDSTVQSGTTSSFPMVMGFKYSPKFLVYNPKESAYVSLDIKENTWAEVRYNEMFPDGMTDETSIKNATSSTITYSLKGSRTYNPFIYEHGIIRRSGSNFTSSSQVAIANGTIYLLSVKPLGPETTSGVEMKSVNIYPTSQQKNSVLGRNVWLILHTKPEYVSWWNEAIENEESGVVKMANSTTGIVIASFNSTAIKMGEAYISTTSVTAPSHAQPYRIVKITQDNTYLPVDGISTLVAEVQDRYNNPVPNIVVSFSKNNSRRPGNANAYAQLLQTSAVSGTDGRASVLMRTGGAGFYYIDATVSGISTTFANPASSQGYSLSLTLPISGSGPNYSVNAMLRDGLGGTQNGTIDFDSSDGYLYAASASTVSGAASTILNSSRNTSNLTITGINANSITNSSAFIAWNVANNITVTARTGNVFNYNVTSTNVNSTGCVHYGTTPGNYIYERCSSIINSSHNVSLTSLLPGRAYYFIINSSRFGEIGRNSTEYMFVTISETSPVSDTTPPASVSGLTNATYEPMNINWTWSDPADPDFDHVEIYIDGISNGTVAGGVQSFNASFFAPNSSHTISTRTVDIYGNINSTWVNNTASTSSLFTYVFDFLINTSGTIINEENAKNAGDGGAMANLSKVSLATNQSNRTINPSKTNTTGTQSGSFNTSNLTFRDDLMIDITIPNVASGAHTYDNKSTYQTTSWNTANPGNISYTAGGGASLMVLSIQTSVALRTSGTPTFNGKSFINIGRNIHTSSPEGASELWYLLLTPADTGSAYTVSVPNAPTSRAMTYQVSTYKSSTGISALDINTSGTGSSSNPSQTLLSTANGDVYVSSLFDGRSSCPTGRTGTLLYCNDGGSFIGSSQYYLQASAGSFAMRFTISSDDWAMQTAAFKEVPTYSLNSTYTFTETNSSSTWQSIRINDSSFGDELTNVSILNATSGNWESILTTPFTNSTTPSEHVNVNKGASGNASNYDIGGGQIKIRYNWTDSTSNNSLGVDLINVTVLYANNTYHLNVIANTTNIPGSNFTELQLKYNISGDNFSVQIMNSSSGWENATILNSTGIPYRNITLNSSWLLPSGTFPGNVASINKYYVNVRYLDLNQSVNGTLYLDYQRVYSI